MINSNLNITDEPVQASLIIRIQMLTLGNPAIYVGNSLVGISGMFTTLAISYASGSDISPLVKKNA